jgi:hypothetical protein
MKIGRNDPCPCGSGKKYKKCCLNRLNEEPIKPYEIGKIFRDAFNKEYCSVPNALKVECSGDIVKAHTVTKSSSLKEIAQNGHVYGFKPNPQRLINSNGRLEFVKIGINEASIFTGFCSKHDNDIFRIIENGGFNSTKEECFLHAYRGLCREYFIKKAALDLKQKSDILNEGVKAGMGDLEKHKRDFDKILLSKDFNNLNAFIIKFKNIPTMVASGGSFPVYDFNGKLLRDKIDFDNPGIIPSAFYCNSFISEGSGYFIFSWIRNFDNVRERFIDSLIQIKPDRITDAIIRFLFSSCENIFANPTWWESIGRDKQIGLTNRMQSAANHFEDYREDYLKEDNIMYSDWEFEKYIELIS